MNTKRVLLTAAIVLVATMTALAGGKKLKMPAPLKAGDKIAIISPASTPGEDNPEKAAATLRAWGFVPVIGQHVLAKYHAYAGTIE